MDLNYGFAVVDLTGYDYSSSSSQTVAGVHAACKKAYESGMPILIYGWDYNDVPLSPMMVYVMPSSTNFIIDGKIQVASNDAITVL